MEAADSSPSAEVSSVAMRILPFWAQRLAVWIVQYKVQFTLVSISSGLAAGPPVRQEGRGHFHLPDQYTYTTTLKFELVKRLFLSREQRMR
jgi:hypothetical protein